MDTSKDAITGGSSTPASTPNSVRKMPGTIVWVLVLVVVVVVALFVAYQKGTFGALSGDQAFIDQSSIVATVNGVHITRDEFTKKTNQIRATMPNMATDTVSVQTFENQVLDEMIDLKLLVARAQERNIQVSDDQLDTEIEKLIQLFQGKEKLDAQLVQMGLTYEQLRDNMKNELMIKALLDVETNMKDVTITDEELRAVYDKAYPAGTENAIAFDDIKGMLSAQLINQKSTSIITKYREDIRSAAQIEKFL